MTNINIVTLTDSMTADAQVPTGDSFSISVGAISLDNISVVPFDGSIAFNRDYADEYTWDGFKAECDDWDDAFDRFIWG